MIYFNVFNIRLGTLFWKKCFILKWYFQPKVSTRVTKYLEVKITLFFFIFYFFNFHPVEINEPFKIKSDLLKQLSEKKILLQKMHALKHPKALTFQLLKWDPLKIDRRGLSSIPAYLMGKYLKKCISLFFSCLHNMLMAKTSIFPISFLELWLQFVYLLFVYFYFS